MFKTIAATALSATLAFATLTPAPAQAQGIDQNEIAKFLLGIGVAALIAKAMDEANDDDDDREVHIHREVNKVIERPAPSRRVVVKEPPRKVFITHGEESQATAFQKFLTDKTGWTCVVPEYEQEVVLD